MRRAMLALMLRATEWQDPTLRRRCEPTRAGGLRRYAATEHVRLLVAPAGPAIACAKRQAPPIAAWPTASSFQKQFYFYSFVIPEAIHWRASPSTWVLITATMRVEMLSALLGACAALQLVPVARPAAPLAAPRMLSHARSTGVVASAAAPPPALPASSLDVAAMLRSGAPKLRSSSARGASARQAWVERRLPSVSPVSMAADASPKKVGVVGVTGAVGQEIIAVLQDRGFPMSELKLFASARSAGKPMETPNGQSLMIEEFTLAAARECDIVFLAVSGDFALEWAEKISEGEDGAVVIDNSSAFRYKDGVPLVVPEINAEVARRSKSKLIANPNCTTAIALMALAPLHKVRPARRVLFWRGSHPRLQPPPSPAWPLVAQGAPPPLK